MFVLSLKFQVVRIATKNVMYMNVLENDQYTNEFIIQTLIIVVKTCSCIACKFICQFPSDSTKITGYNLVVLVERKPKY